MSERRSRIDVAGQLRLLTPLALAWAAGASVLTAAGVQRSIPLEQLFLDPSTLAGAPWYSGVISNLGILCWTAGAVTAAGGSWVAARTGRPSAARFLGAGAVVGTVFLLDDLLRIHSGLARDLFGIPKTAALALIIAPSLVWVVLWRAEIARTRWLILLGFFAGSAVSVAVDRIVAPTGAAGLFAEDGAKFMGVVAWAIYCATTVADIVRSTIDAAMRAANPTSSTAPERGDTRRVSGV